MRSISAEHLRSMRDDVDVADVIRTLEIPVEYRARIGEVKLNTWDDGVQNLWFLVTKMADFR